MATVSKSDNAQSHESDAKEKRPLVTRKLTAESILFFRDQVRCARDAAIRNSENYHEALFVIERLGQYIFPEGSGLGPYRDHIESALDIKDEDFGPLYTAVSQARNDALHQGAFARHLTANAIRLLIKLEGFLMTKFANENKALTVEHYMVRNPICAEPWMPLSFARQMLLANSFSSIPVYCGQRWRFLFDTELVMYAQGKTGNERKKRLSTPIEEAQKSGLRLHEARLISKDLSVQDFLKNSVPEGMESYPVLVIREAEDGTPLGVNPPHLVGIMSAFDLL